MGLRVNKKKPATCAQLAPSTVFFLSYLAHVPCYLGVTIFSTVGSLLLHKLSRRKKQKKDRKCICLYLTGAVCAGRAVQLAMYGLFTGAPVQVERAPIFS